MPASSLCGDCVHMVHRYTFRKYTYTPEIKMKVSLKKFSSWSWGHN